MLCCEKKTRVDADWPVETDPRSPSAGTGGGRPTNGGVNGLRRNRNVRFTNLKLLAEEPEDPVDDPRNGTAAAMRDDDGGEAVEPAAAAATVVVTFEQGEPCNETDDEEDGNDNGPGPDGTMMAGQQPPPVPGGSDDASKSAADQADPETGCCMQCAYVTVEFCGCSIF